MPITAMLLSTHNTPDVWRKMYDKHVFSSGFLAANNWVTLRCCRIVLTDHGTFVLINVYAPNAGPAPERPRAAYKCRFLQALHSKAVKLRDAGRQVSFCISTCHLTNFVILALLRHCHTLYNLTLLCMSSRISTETCDMYFFLSPMLFGQIRGRLTQHSCRVPQFNGE